MVATTLGLERCFCHFLRFEIRFEICFCLRTKFPTSGLSKLRQRNENINREFGSQKEMPDSHTTSKNFPPSLKTVQWIPSHFICFTLWLTLPVPHRVKAKASTPDPLSSKVTDISTAFTLSIHLIEVKLLFEEKRWLGCSTLPTLKPCYCHLFFIKPHEVSNTTSCWNSLRSSFWEWGLPYFRHLFQTVLQDLG